MTNLSDDFVLDFVEFCFRYGAVHVSAMQVSDDYHPFFIPAIVYEPSLRRDDQSLYQSLEVICIPRALRHKKGS